MKKGIAVAGSLLVDRLHGIDVYPKEGALVQIRSIENAVGGCVPNVGIDIAKISDIPVYAVGRVGEDEEGKFALDTLKENGVDVSFVSSHTQKTSFTEVMSVSGGQRTFFTYAGASADFGYDDIDWERLTVKHLHLGYFLLLDKVDKGDGLRILQEAKRRGISTSIDLVSEQSNRYKEVLPCLPFVDDLIINEVEAGQLAGISPERGNLPKIAQKLKEYGVKNRVIIHEPMLGICLSERGFSYLPSYQIEKSFIKGTTGAGDAFCAGALCGIYKGVSDMEILSLASMSATCALSSVDATSGMRKEEEMREFCKDLKRRDICLSI